MKTIDISSAPDQLEISGDVVLTGVRKDPITFYGEGTDLKLFASASLLGKVSFIGYSYLFINRAFTTGTIHIEKCVSAWIKDVSVRGGGIDISQPENITKIVISGCQIHDSEFHGIDIGPIVEMDTAISNLHIYNTCVSRSRLNGIQIGNVKWYRLENVVSFDNGLNKFSGISNDLRILPNCRGLVTSSYIPNIMDRTLTIKHEH